MYRLWVKLPVVTVVTANKALRVLATDMGKVTGQRDANTSMEDYTLV